MDLHLLHRALLRPETYPEETGPIGYRETHISRLYFTDRHVYKVKKPVDYGFLNFTTLDRRRFYCQEEVRLNRRFAPGTYLGVVEIRRRGERIRVGGEGEIVDYAVLMVRLPEERMLPCLLARDDPSLPGEMDRLAARVAELHRSSGVCRGEGGRSNLEVVRYNWQENFAQTAPLADKTLSARAQAHCSAFVGRFLEEQAALLLRREADGFVRDGHGDLHAEHICLTDPIRIYDCIEFNRRFRVADLAADLAFLLMDLEFRGRRDLAARLLETYGKALGMDRETQLLLPFYKLYRAWVRGKVESFLAADASAGEEERQRAAASATQHFNLALGYLCPPVLLVTCGLMGVGKTTLAKALARSLGACLLRSDQLRKELAGVPETEPRPEPFGQGIYSAAFTRRTYDLLLEKSRQALTAGRSVVADASSGRRSQRERFRQAAASAGAACLILHLECDPQITLRRLDRRTAEGRDASDGRRELFAAQSAVFEHPVADEVVIRVDSAKTIDYNVHLVLCAILDRTGVNP